MKSYFDIEGDGGSDIVGQVTAQRAELEESLAGVRHLVAVGSGKGGVGKSTLTMALAQVLRRRGHSVALFDADFNGPCQARMAGLEETPWVPGANGLILPRRSDGLGVLSMGSVFGGDKPFDPEHGAAGHSYVWRATREFSVFGQLLAAVDWGTLDFLLLDLPPGAERTVHFADFLGPRAAFVLVTIPSDLARGVVSRSVAALEETDSPLTGYVLNMAGYYCRECDGVRPLFPEGDEILDAPLLGRVPFDPELASICDRGWPEAAALPPSAAALAGVVDRLLASPLPAAQTPPSPT
ncbi:MAG: P-loop NTPase [Acidobacteriota bacterium]